MRNSLQTGMLTFNDAQGGNLFFRACHAVAQAEGVPFPGNFMNTLNKKLPKEITDETFSSTERSKYYQQYALRVIRKYPGHF